MKNACSRITRVNELIKREIADMLEKSIEHNPNTLVSVTEVDTSPDLRHAKVYISVYGDKAAKGKTFRLLNKQRAHIQHTMARDLKLKYTPVLEFDDDQRLAAGDRVLEIITELEEE